MYIWFVCTHTELYLKRFIISRFLWSWFWIENEFWWEPLSGVALCLITHLLNDADKTNAAANVHMVLATAENESLRCNDGQIHKVRHYSGPSGYLKQPNKSTIVYHISLRGLVSCVQMFPQNTISELEYFTTLWSLEIRLFKNRVTFYKYK